MLIMEIFDSFCSYLSILAAAYYCAADAPEGMLGSLNGIVIAALFGAGTLNYKLNRSCDYKKIYRKRYWNTRR